MLEPTFKKLFSKELKLMEKRHKNIYKLRDVMNMLIQEIPLPPKHENHPLYGEYKGWWECHVEPDWLLIYRVDKENRRVIFYRTGTHSDLL
jgi:mRNA interferase YafQ